MTRFLHAFFVDLYEAEFAEDPVEETSKPEPALSTAAPATSDPRANAAAKPLESYITVPKSAPVSMPASSISAPAPQPIATYESNTGSAPTFTQKIPTYEEPATDYSVPRTQPGGAAAAGFQSLNAQERSVRPSEMKDEG